LKSLYSATPLAFNAPDGGVPLGRSLQNFTWKSTDGQHTKWHRNIAKNFNRQVGHTNITDTHNTAYSEREHSCSTAHNALAVNPCIFKVLRWVSANSDQHYDTSA